MLKKKCNACGVKKAVSEFYAHPENSDRLQGKCRECMKLYANARNKRLREAKKKARS